MQAIVEVVVAQEDRTGIAQRIGSERARRTLARLALTVVVAGSAVFGSWLGPDGRHGVAEASSEVLDPTARLPCSQESSLRSTSGDQPTAIRFINQTATILDIYWINYNGERVHYFTLAPGTSYVQLTFLTHPWVVTDTSGRCLAIFTPGPTESDAVIAPTPALIGPPTDEDECKDGGWRRFTNPPFKNQGDCVSYVNHHRR